MRLLIILSTVIICTWSKPQRNPYLPESDRPNPGQLQAYVKFSASDIRNLKTRGYALPIATSAPSQIPAGFRSTFAPSTLIDSSTASTHQRKPIYDNENYPVANSLSIQGRPQQGLRRPQQPQQFRQGEQDSKEVSLEEEEKEEPDRLSLLLPNSKFDCTSKITGYYADEGLNCEVFHYCQDNVKHSWICPEGFSFHQVHLICMPPSSENICEKSSQFHFVNDYLYKPLNMEEALTKPNVSLRYSDRYYPDSYYESEDNEESQHIPRKQPIQVGFQKQIQQQQQTVSRQRTYQPPQQHFTPTLRPETTLYRSTTHGQVFHSPEEVNISLQQRRPPYLLTQRSYQQPQEFEYE